MRPVASFALGLILILILTSALAASGATKEIQKLEKTLARDQDANARAEAAWQLGQSGSTESVPALITALEQDSSSAVRANAAASLWHLGDASRAAIPALTKALDDRSGTVIGNAAGALLELGTPKSKLVPVYRELLTRNSCEVRVVGLKALAAEDPPVDLFDTAWECTEPTDAIDSDVRSVAGDALRKIVSRKDRKLIPVLLELLEDSRGRDVTTLISGIASYTPPVNEAVPVLAELLEEHNERTSSAAASALGDMKLAALPALPALIRCLATHPQNETREDAAEAIGEIGEKASAAVPALIKAGESDKWPTVRKAAVTALGEMRTEAKAAIPMLRKALQSPDDWMRMAARNALFRVEPGASQEVADIADQHKVEEKGILYNDLTQLSATLPARLPEVYELLIYDKFAYATVAQSDSPTSRARYTYKAGTVTGPEESSSGDCNKKVALAKINFTVVPRLVQQAPTLLGKPSNEVSHVQLSGGMFCKAIHWLVYVKEAGYVEFKLDGKAGKVLKF